METVAVDLERVTQVRAAVAGADLVVVAAGRPDLAGAFAREVIAAGADWADMMLSGPRKHAALEARAAEMRDAGVTFVTDCGLHPGLPGLLIRWVDAQFDRLLEADVFMAVHDDYAAAQLSDSTIAELLDDFSSYELAAWVEGERRTIGPRGWPVVEFSSPIGRKRCVPLALPEVDRLAATLPGLRRRGFYGSGFGTAMDYAILPALSVAARSPPLRPAAIRAGRAAVRRFCATPPPHLTQVRLEASGLVNGTPARASAVLSTKSGYTLTAARVVALLTRLLDGSVGEPGLHLQALLGDPEAIRDDVAAMGVGVERHRPAREPGHPQA